MNEFLEQFLIESRELMAQATDDLLILERSPGDRARLDSAFRAFHTLKGAAGIMEFGAMGRAVHAIEDVLSGVRTGHGQIDTKLITSCLACIDLLADWLAAMETTGKPPDEADEAAVQFIADLRKGEAPANTVALALEDGSPGWVDDLLSRYAGTEPPTVAVRYVPEPDAFFRDEDPLAIVKALPGLLLLNVQPRTPWPTLTELDPHACNLVFDLLSNASREALASHLAAVRTQIKLCDVSGRRAGSFPEAAAKLLGEQIALCLIPPDPQSSARMASAGRVATNVLRHLGRAKQASRVDDALARNLTASNPIDFVETLREILQGAPDIPDRSIGNDAGQTFPRESETTVQTLRVDVKRIDAIVRLTGELTVAKNALGHVVRMGQEGSDPKRVLDALKHQHAMFERLTGELLNSVLAIRVLPLRQVFQRFPRLVRDIAATLSKDVRLVIEGEGTEADKAIVEALFEPLLHVIRNAIDHGVEDVDLRVSRAKPVPATVRLSAYRKGDHVIVEVSDDGRGIEASRIRSVAAARGLMSEAALGELSDEHVIDLIFTPGFSTATAVSDLSGRGVGMDAVRSAIARLGGTVVVETIVGSGTAIRLTLPFTVMMSRVLAVEAAGQVFGVPFEAVSENLQLPRNRIMPVGGGEAFVLREMTVPLLNLTRLLDISGYRETPSEIAKIVVTRVNGILGGLEVDRLGERLDVMVTPMDGVLSGAPFVSGTTLLGDGRVMLVLNIEELMR